jgi:3-hydroxyacyl-CoA dehydrogenase
MAAAMHARRIGIIGCGLIGRGWAIVFARAGYETLLYDAQGGAVGHALSVIEDNLRDLVERGLIDSTAAVRTRMHPCTKLEEALADVAYVQESVPEDRALKARVFAELDALAPPDAVLGSSCSAIPGSEFMADIPGRARCLIAHPANPPYLMPVVELVPTPFTSDATIERCSALMAEIGQVPVLLKKEVPGFVMNRLQAGVVNEAVQLVQSGVMSAEDIDKVMRYSLGLRWSFMGPFETMDLNAPDGFADYAKRYGKSYETMGRALRVAEPWAAATVDAIEAERRRLIPKDQVAARQAWRDRRLMALLAHIADSDRKFGR